jgi:serine/threonine protein kinase
VQIALEVVQGPHSGRRFTFDGHDNFIVGRARCAHFRLPDKDPYFSRVHFMVEVNPPNCRLVDMGSTNGTGLNGHRVDSADLKHGDLIQGGDTVLRVSLLYTPGEASCDAAEPEHPLAAHIGPSRQAFQSTETFHPSAPTIEGYQMVRRLGGGGMGVVYLARRASDSSLVALKTIQPAVAASERQVQRFLREAGILRKLRHPHIVTFHEMGRAGEVVYFAMDYVPGTDAAELLHREGPLPVTRAVRLVCQVLEALAYAHGRGFVHRDVKPSNLLVTGQKVFETCRLADFGLARVYNASPLSGLTLMDDAGGTIPYMPPEQITNYRNASPPADQYSTAATLYRLLTGQYLFDFEEGPNERHLTKILFDEPVPIGDRRPEVRDALAWVIHRALHKDPAGRFPDTATFREALLPYAGDVN